MDKNCPSCGNKNEFTPTLLNEVYICEECGSEFSESTNEILTPPNYKMLCERVVRKMRGNLNDAIIASAIGELSEGYINDGSEYAKDFIKKLSGLATDLYVDHQAGMREKYDFNAIMEGVETLIEFYNLQNPQDEEFSPIEDEEEEEEGGESEEAQNGDIEFPSAIFGDDDEDVVDDVASMAGADASPNEKMEHAALDSLKSTVQTLSSSLNMLAAAEEQEMEDGGDEGEGHEAEEAELIANIKGAVKEIQSNLNEYLQTETNAHYNAPTIRNVVDDVVASIDSGAIDESMAAMRAQIQEICSETKNMLQECGYGIDEDAQLVTQGHVDSQLAQSIDTNTSEFGNVVETVAGGQNVDPDLLGPVGVEPPSAEDQLAAGNELELPPDIENIPVDNAYHGDPGFEDEKEVPGEVEDGEFRTNQSVVFEGEYWTIKGVNNTSLILESDNGEVIETEMENVELSDREGFDAMEEHYERGTDNLKAIWAQMEESIGKSKSLMQPVRRFDLREGAFKGAPGMVRLPPGVGPRSKVDPEKTLPGKMDFDSQPAPKDKFVSLDIVKKKSASRGVFSIVRVEATPKDGDGKVFYDMVEFDGKFYMRKSVRGADGKDIAAPEDLVRDGSKEDLIGKLNDNLDIDVTNMRVIFKRLEAISYLRNNPDMPNSNVSI